MEEFDLVDEYDTVISVTDKDTAHANGDIHRVAAVYVFDPEGRLYVQEHLKSGGKFDHSIGGHIRKGETYDQAAKREAFEELGISDPLKKISVFYSDETFRGGKQRHMFGLYECVPSNDWEFVPNDEVQKIIPMTIEDIVSLMNKDHLKFTAGFINSMKEYIRQKGLEYKISI